MTRAVDLADLGRSISERFGEIATVHARKVAIRTPLAAITYGELDERSEQVAGFVRERLAETGPRAVVTVFPQGIDAIAVQLGILRAGGFYVPAGARDPPARLYELAARVGSRLVLAEDSCAASLQVHAARQVPVVPMGAVLASARGPLRAPHPDPDQLAYVYYTSGSTGSPKGVADNHRNVIHNVLRYTRSLGITCADRLTLLQPPTFSGAVSSTYAALLNGGTLLAYDLQQHGPAGLARFIAEHEATIYHSVPSIFRNLVAGRAQFPAMRHVRLEGDRALARDALLFQEHFARPCQLVNGLGTTETGLVRQYFVTHDTHVAAGPLPIGYPVTGTECLVVNDAGVPVPDGERGEIVVGSDYLAVGYWRDDALTRRKFEPHGAQRRYRTGDFGRMRPDGCLEYLGRSEAEPRIHGVTIDRAALERALLGITDVMDAAVTTTEGAAGDAELIAAVAVGAGSRMDAATLRERLRAELPAHAVPAHVIVADALPLTAFGKIDRGALARMIVRREPRPVEASGPEGLEGEVAGIWRSVLGRERVDARQSFLEHGGDSLQAMQILVRIADRFGVELSPSQFFALPTIAEQATFVQAMLAGVASAGR